MKTGTLVQKNWTLILGCSIFILVGAIAVSSGASLPTAAFRAVVASFLGGLFGFLMDYFAAHAPVLPSTPRRPAAADSPAQVESDGAEAPAAVEE